MIFDGYYLLALSYASGFVRLEWWNGTMEWNGGMHAWNS